MISSDRNILVDKSAVSERMKEYATFVEELHIILLCNASHGLKEKKIDINVWVYPTNSLASFLRPITAASMGKKLILDKKFVRGRSVITADSIECGWAGLQIKNTWRLPLEVQLHTDPLSEYFSGFQNWVRRAIAPSVLKQADSIRVVGNSLKTSIAKYFSIPEDKIYVLPIYIDLTRTQSEQIKFDLHGRFGWKFIMLCVARLTREKNLGLALEVLARVREHFPGSGLVIVGSGPEESKLKRKAAKLGVESAVAFAGWQQELTSYYRTANLFLQTSYFEGYGLALVEAGLSGLPIVSTPVGIVNDLENGTDLIVCPQNDPEYMFKAVYDLVGDNQKREVLSVNIKHKLEKMFLSKEVYLERLNRAWEDCASKVEI